jgi:16S rRNA (cytosine967-C5)-methyltransferase
LTDQVRRTALDLIDAITGERRLMSDLLPEALAHLEPSGRARAQRLANETLRWSDRADRMLGPFLRRRPPLRTLNALRLGVWEICGESEPPHGPVDAIVGILSASPATRRTAGLANAVLRRVGEAGPAAWNGLPLPRLPRPLRRRLVAAWGNAAVTAMEAAHAAGAPLDLTPRDGNAVALADRLGGVALPSGSVRVPRRGPITALPGYAEGDWWVQDAAAAVPARLADPREGERALDLCAAPGGKTLQLAATGAGVTAVDHSASRMARLAENLARCRLSAQTVVADVLAWEGGGFDLALVDAPCSATGTIRRHPDLPHAKDLSDLARLADLQARLLDRAVAAVRPGGRIVYCVCSLLPEEGEAQVDAALARYPQLSVDRAGPDWTAAWRDDRGGLRLRPDHWPELGGLDGFYVCRFRVAAGAM